MKDETYGLLEASVSKRFLSVLLLFMVFVLLLSVLMSGGGFVSVVRAGIGPNGESVFDGGWYDVWPEKLGTTTQVGAYYTTGGWVFHDGQWMYLEPGVHRIYKTVVSFPKHLEDPTPVIIKYEDRLAS